MRKFLSLFLVCLIVVTAFGCKGKDSDNGGDNTPAPCTHNYEVTLSVDATCNSYSTTRYACSLCGDTYTETGTEYAGHDYEYFSSTVGNCQTKSSTTNKCSICGDTSVSYGNYGNHSYFINSSTAGTCQVKSSTTYKCSTCSDTYTTYGSYGNHSGVKTCSCCSTSFYVLLKNYIVSNGIKTSSGSYGITLRNDLLATIALMYNPSENYIFCAEQGTMGLGAVTFHSDLSCEWYYLTSTDYIFYGDITPSSFVSASSLSYSTDCPSAVLSICLGYVRNSINSIFDSLSYKITNSNMGFTLYNLGFTSYS